MWRSQDQIICSMDSVKPMDKRRVIRTFVDWIALHETKEKGIYSQGLIRSIDNPN